MTPSLLSAGSGMRARVQAKLLSGKIVETDAVDVLTQRTGKSGPPGISAARRRRISGNARRREISDARFTCIFFNPLQFLLAQKLISGYNP
jgi:hypothetical protein